MPATVKHALGASYPNDARVPLVLENERLAFEAALSTIGPIAPANARLAWIKDTASLASLAVSKACLAEMESHPEVELV